MDLTGISTIKTTYATDPVLQITTITFSDSSGSTVYGTIVLEAGKHRAFMDAMTTIADTLVKANDPNLLKHRVMLDKNNLVATTVFV